MDSVVLWWAVLNFDTQFEMGTQPYLTGREKPKPSHARSHIRRPGDLDKTPTQRFECPKPVVPCNVVGWALRALIPLTATQLCLPTTRKNGLLFGSIQRVSACILEEDFVSCGVMVTVWGNRSLYG